MEKGRDPNRYRKNAAEESGGATTIIPARSRWRPTREQKQILERLYEQGLRKPCADQIQQITARLKALGPIEPKNVFYWFHNFNAKLKLKLKQVHEQEKAKEHSSLLNTASRDITTTSTVVRSTCNNQEKDSNTKQCMYTRSFSRTSASMTARSSLNLEKGLANNIYRNNNDGKTLSAGEGSRYEYRCRPVDSRYVVNDDNTVMISNNSTENSETLVLFPLTPTSGTLRRRDYHEEEIFSGNNDKGNGLSGGQPYYDFFSMKMS